MSDSRQPDFDWHKDGVYAIIGPDDIMTFNQVFVGTPWHARAMFLQWANRPWSKCAEDGYYVQEYVRAP